MLFPSSGFKSVSSGTGLVTEASYEEDDHEIQGEGVQKEVRSEPIGRNRQRMPFIRAQFGNGGVMRTAPLLESREK
jgi:hypothetical protein